LLCATGCGGSNDAMRATLTDDGCSYTGGTSLPSGQPSTIEVENRSSKFAAFWLYELGDEVTLARVDRTFREFPTTGNAAQLAPLFERPISMATTDAGATSELTIGERAGRYVVVCVEPKLDAERSPDDPISPDHLYAPAELVVAG